MAVLICVCSWISVPAKDGMGFRRYLSRGKKNVPAESIIVAMARNINKLHAKIQSDRTDVHLYSLKEA